MCPMRSSPRKPTTSWYWNYGGRRQQFWGMFHDVSRGLGNRNRRRKRERCVTHQICAVKKSERRREGHRLVWKCGKRHSLRSSWPCASAFKRTGWHIKCFHLCRVPRRTQTPRNFKRARFSTPPGDQKLWSFTQTEMSLHHGGFRLPEIMFNFWKASWNTQKYSQIWIFIILHDEIISIIAFWVPWSRCACRYGWLRSRGKMNLVSWALQEHIFSSAKVDSIWVSVS